jgi:hypothetical protein
MGEAVLVRKFPFLKKCDVCGKLRHELYEINLDGVPVYVCTGAEAVTARDRWMEKKKLGISPFQSKSKNEDAIMESGGIPSEEEGEL